MRNIVKSSNGILQSNPEYQSVPTGTLFRFVEPWCPENIYMKTNNPSYCFHINTGNLFTIKDDKRIVPLYNEEVSVRNAW